jgi:hypothetical protein
LYRIEENADLVSVGDSSEVAKDRSEAKIGNDGRHNENQAISQRCGTQESEYQNSTDRPFNLATQTGHGITP